MRGFVLRAGGALSAVALTVSWSSARSVAPSSAPVPRAGVAQGPACTSVPTISPVLPSDMATSSQAAANCFAWQQFIALNWPAAAGTCATADGSAPFGKPNDAAPVVWETYKEASEVFLPDAETPGPFCSPQALPAALRSAKGLRPTSPHGYKVLTMPSKFAANATLDLSSFTEAGTGGAWLTAQSGLLTMYEVRMGQDEFDYIVTNRLYDATAQAAFAAAGGIQLPDGASEGGQVGSIEVKAAWTELDDPAKWPLFKISQAVVKYPGQSPRTVTMGLVGLHIIHKTALGQQFIWATFEHVNNAPSTADLQTPPLPEPWYTFYDAACDPATDHYACKENAEPVPGTDPYDAPVQVVRMNPIDNSPTNEIEGLNQSVWKLLGADSVFRNYQLVNVLWPSANTPLSGPTRVPLPQGDPTPTPPSQGGSEVVANATLETYFQQQLACLDCHASAPVASTAREGARMKIDPPASSTAPTSTPPLGADYSFLLSRAQVAPSSSPSTLPAAGVAMGGAAVVIGGLVAARRRRSRRASEASP